MLHGRRVRALSAVVLAAFLLACRIWAESPQAPAAPTSQPTTSAPADWARPRSDDRKLERERMVKHQIEFRDVKDPDVLEAMRNVPRHWFVPTDQARWAYSDSPLSIGEGQTISQPYIVARMTEALGVKPEHKVLEIGTGSGYQAAVLNELTPHVYTIEIVEPLARRAAATFKDRGYTSIQARCGDGKTGQVHHCTQPQHREAQVAGARHQGLGLLADVAPVRGFGRAELCLGLALGHAHQFQKLEVVFQVLATRRVCVGQRLQPGFHH